MARKYLRIALVVLCLLCTSLVVIPAVQSPEKIAAENEARPSSSKPVPQAKGLDTTAASAILMDAAGNILFEKDPHKPLPPASVTKVMTLLLAVEALEAGKVKLTDDVTISENAWKMGGSQIWLEPGERMTLQELLYAVAVASANDASIAVAEHIAGTEEAFVAMMNEKARELGLKNTHFANPTGLPAENHYMSAYDTAQIVRYALRYPKYMELVQIKEHWLRDGKTWLVNTNKLLWWYKGADGFKTGWTEEAKYCLAATAKRDNLRLIAVVFATPEPRSHFREAMKLMDYGFANYTGVPVIQRGAVVERVRVYKGTEQEVELVASDDLNLTLPKGQAKNIEKRVQVAGRVMAPVNYGQKLGELVAVRDGKELGRVDLVAAKEVKKARFLRIFRDMVMSMFNFGR